MELGSLSNLVQLVLWGNELTGGIPAELGSLTNLELLSLSTNQLTGEYPPNWAAYPICKNSGSQLTS